MKLKCICICAFALAAFTACEHKKTTTIANGDTTVVVEERSIGFSRETIRKESEDMARKLEALKERAKTATGPAGEKIRQKIDELEKQRQDVTSDSTDSKIGNAWDNFKSKARQAIDSLDKKI